MEVGVQIVDTVPANSSIDYSTYGWDPAWDVAWTVVPTSPAAGQPQVEWSVAVERATSTSVTYYVTITNLTSSDVGVEGRYAILNL
jgi:hypothetical protein